jgi:hypothetical protein
MSLLVIAREMWWTNQELLEKQMCSLVSEMHTTSIILMMEAINKFETSVSIFEITLHNIPEDLQLLFLFVYKFHLLIARTRMARKKCVSLPQASSEI